VTGSRAWRIAFVAVLALGLAVRVGVFVHDPNPNNGAGLSAEQAEMARNIVDHGRWFVTDPVALATVKARQATERRLIPLSEFQFRSTNVHYDPEIGQMPGLSVVMAGLWWVTGNETYRPVQWLQLALDTAMAALVWWIAFTLTRRRGVALLAALLYALWPGAVVVAKRPMLDTWAGFFTIACTALFVWARAEPARLRRLVALGAVSGLGIYFRPFVLVVPIALALVATPGGGGRRRLLVWLSVPTAVALVVLAPWTIRNAYEFHKFIPTRTGLGQALSEGIGQTSSDTAAQALVRRHHPGAHYQSPQYDNFLIRHAIGDIVHHPGRYADLLANRLKYLAPCLLLVVLWRRWRREALLLVAVAAAVVIPYIPIGGDTRFYLPAAFAYLILAAMAAEVIRASVARRSAG
jgi:4-amino-4-deoxy-L-arabinose transferase-like glycosyltransferase